jgi:hypothetical protein
MLDGPEDYEVLKFDNEDDYIGDDVDVEALFEGESKFGATSHFRSL